MSTAPENNLHIMREKLRIAKTRNVKKGNSYFCQVKGRATQISLALIQGNIILESGLRYIDDVPQHDNKLLWSLINKEHHTDVEENTRFTEILELVSNSYNEITNISTFKVKFNTRSYSTTKQSAVQPFWNGKYDFYVIFVHNNNQVLSDIETCDYHQSCPIQVLDNFEHDDSCLTDDSSSTEEQIIEILPTISPFSTQTIFKSIEIRPNIGYSPQPYYILLNGSDFINPAVFWKNSWELKIGRSASPVSLIMVEKDLRIRVQSDVPPKKYQDNIAPVFIEFGYGIVNATMQGFKYCDKYKPLHRLQDNNISVQATKEPADMETIIIGYHPNNDYQQVDDVNLLQEQQTLDFEDTLSSIHYLLCEVNVYSFMNDFVNEIRMHIPTKKTGMVDENVSLFVFIILLPLSHS